MEIFDIGGLTSGLTQLDFLPTWAPSLRFVRIPAETNTTIFTFLAQES